MTTLCLVHTHILTTYVRVDVCLCVRVCGGRGP